MQVIKPVQCLLLEFLLGEHAVATHQQQQHNTKAVKRPEAANS
jgi:hypothetical protein